MPPGTVAVAFAACFGFLRGLEREWRDRNRDDIVVFFFAKSGHIEWSAVSILLRSLWSSVFLITPERLGRKVLFISDISLGIRYCVYVFNMLKNNFHINFHIYIQFPVSSHLIGGRLYNRTQLRPLLRKIRTRNAFIRQHDGAKGSLTSHRKKTIENNKHLLLARFRAILQSSSDNYSWSTDSSIKDLCTYCGQMRDRICTRSVLGLCVRRVHARMTSTIYIYIFFYYVADVTRAWS